MGTKENPDDLSKLISLLRSKLGHILTKVPFDITNVFRTKKPFINTEGVFVVIQHKIYKISKKTFRDRGVLTNDGKLFPFNSIQECYRMEYPSLDLSLYHVGSYRMSEGGGWYSNQSLYLYKGIYYTQF